MILLRTVFSVVVGPVVLRDGIEHDAIIPVPQSKEAVQAAGGNDTRLCTFGLVLGRVNDTRVDKLGERRVLPADRVPYTNLASTSQLRRQRDRPPSNRPPYCPPRR